MAEAPLPDVKEDVAHEADTKSPRNPVEDGRHQHGRDQDGDTYADFRFCPGFQECKRETQGSLHDKLLEDGQEGSKKIDDEATFALQ